MKVRKAVDTIQGYGQAENYIEMDVNFRKFLSKMFPGRDTMDIANFIKTLHPEYVVKEYNLKGIVFGNYVTQEERYYLLYKVVAQLEILRMYRHGLRGPRTADIGLGRLVIAFGSEGISKFAAHFNPAKDLININRGRKQSHKTYMQGEDSFIHEYAHFVDFVLGRKNQSHNKNFDSESPETRLGKLTRIATQDAEYMERLEGQSNTKYLQSDIEVFARLIEAAVTHDVQKSHPDWAPFFPQKYTDFIYLEKAKIEKAKVISTFKSVMRGLPSGRNKK